MNKYRAQSQAAQATRRRERMCDRKKPYPSAEAAQQKGQRTYRCPHCRLWHRSGSLAALVAKVSR